MILSPSDYIRQTETTLLAEAFLPSKGMYQGKPTDFFSFSRTLAGTIDLLEQRSGKRAGCVFVALSASLLHQNVTEVEVSILGHMYQKKI